MFLANQSKSRVVVQSPDKNLASKQKELAKIISVCGLPQTCKTTFSKKHRGVLDNTNIIV